VFPPTPLQSNVANVPVILVPNQLLALIGMITGPQDDANNGLLFVAVTDCAGTPVPGAALSVKQGANEVGTQFDLSAVAPQAAGLYLVVNVPAGDTDVGATFNGQAFRSHTVKSFKNGNGVVAGATTTTTVRPGP
jgi:hypothetical protein